MRRRQQYVVSAEDYGKVDDEGRDADPATATDGGQHVTENKQ